MKRHFYASFARVWNTSASLTQVAVRVTRLHGVVVEPEEMVRLAHRCRRMGYDLKEIRPSDLPDLTERNDAERFIPDWALLDAWTEEQVLMKFRGGSPHSRSAGEPGVESLLYDY